MNSDQQGHGSRAFPFGVGIAMALYLAIVLSHFGYTPIWDALEYLEEYLFRVRDSLTLDSFFFSHSGHPSFGYYWIFWIGQELFPYQLAVPKLINIGFGLVSIFAFAQVARQAFQDIVGPAETAILTICFAVHPVFVAYALNMLPEYGVVAYLLATMWCCQAGRYGWAAVAGTFLVFCKETGVVLYTLPLLILVAGRMRSIEWKRKWPLLLPYVALGAFLLYRRWEGQPFSPWSVGWLKDVSLWKMYAPDPLTPEVKMAALLTFVFEFQWIFAGAVAAGLVAGAVAMWRARSAPFATRLGTVLAPLRNFGLLLAAVFYTSSRTLPFANPRYVLAVYPLILLCFLAALLQLGIPRAGRLGVLVGSVFLLFCCNFRTLDPVSKAIAGTINFGDHQMLSIATIRPDPDALNRDELVYNLEHENFPLLIDQAFADIRPTNQTTIVVGQNSWYVFRRVDPRSFRISESRAPAIVTPIQLKPNDIVRQKTKPRSLWYIALPYLPTATDVEQLARFYNYQEHVYAKDGYELHVFAMTLKPGVQAP